VDPSVKSSKKTQLKNKKGTTNKARKVVVDESLEDEWNGFGDETPSGANDDDEEEEEEEETSLITGENPYENLESMAGEVELPNWSKLRLSQPTLRALQSLQFESPTSIQSLAIPRILQGHDLIGKASTGSGKTLAFGIPILEHIISHSTDTDTSTTKSNSPTALIIAPTRELAKQIVTHLEDIAKFSLGQMTIVNIIGGLAIQKQIRILEKRPSVIVGTPGRLWEVLSNPELKHLHLDAALKKIQFLVMDEADRLLQEGHFKEIENILDFVNGGQDKQTLVFSATFQKQLQQKLKGKKSFDGNLLTKDDALGLIPHPPSAKLGERFF
jgi:ATP-dependent RNA helicase DDX24/MAK5